MRKTNSKSAYQLKDSPFYNLHSRAKLSKVLQVPMKALDELSQDNNHYLRRWKHKKLDEWRTEEPFGDAAKNFRQIDIPLPRLKKVQSRIASLLARIQAPYFLFSPVKGRSYVQNAALHANSRAFHLLDIQDYFPSCTGSKVAHFFHSEMKCSKDVSAILVKLVTHGGCLPQGSPCSPILAYYSNMRMWLTIAELVAATNCTLSVYVDDITISGAIVPQALIWEIKKIVHSNRLQLKKSKEISLISAPADITGVIVKNGRTYLPNRQLKLLAELRRERDNAKNLIEKARLEKRIIGRLAQRKQVEQIRQNE